MKALILFLAFSTCAAAQELGPGGDTCTGSCGTPAATINFTAWGTSNDNASNGDTPARKQLGNCATGWDGSNLTPASQPVGQLYCTTAVQTAAQGAGGPAQGVVAATATGTGIAVVTNGNNAGGTDSPVTLTDTYGGTGTDTACTGDTQYAAVVGTVILDVAMPACHASSSALFGESTAAGQPFSDVLLPTSYNDALDSSLYVMRVIHFRVNDLTHLYDLEFDTNYNTSAGYYNGWGMHWNTTAGMFQACPQGCSGWKTMKFTPVGGGSPLTTYALTVSHWYTMAIWYHRGDPSTCTPTAGANCYFYDYIWLYDATAATTPTLYAITDASGNPIGGIPQNRSTWSLNLITTQWQIDMVTSPQSTTVDVDSDTVVFYSK